MHHVLMAMPLLALVLFIFLPWPAALASYIPIVAVSVSMPGQWKVLQAQRRPLVIGPRRLIGGGAVVTDTKVSSRCAIRAKAGRPLRLNRYSAAGR
jgi:hypothetical protein